MTMTKIPNAGRKLAGGGLKLGFWILSGIWCSGFEIFEFLRVLRADSVAVAFVVQSAIGN